MQAWAGIVLAQLGLLALALRRVWRARAAVAGEAVVPESERGLGRASAVWPPGVAMLSLASLAIMVFAGHGGGWTVLAMIGTSMLAADQLVLGGALVASLCTRPQPEAS